MIAVAMAYAAAIGVALAIAGVGLDRLAALRRLPRRGIWTCALVATLAVASLPWWLAPTQLTPISVSIDVTTTSVDSPTPSSPPSAIQRLRIEAGRASVSLAEWNQTAGRLWLLGSAALGLVALARLAVVARRRRRWTPTDVAGTTVLVSATDGPGVVGAFAPQIVLPRWALRLDPTDLQLILQHEREHVTARDAMLIRLAGLAVLLTPWNPALWWIVSKLKLAIELDCDARVLARAGQTTPQFDAADYAELLLAVATHRSHSPALPAPAMLEPPSSLGRRIAAMTPIRTRFARAQSACAAAVSLAVLAAVFTIPVPRVRAQSQPQPAPVPTATPAPKAPAKKAPAPAKAPARAPVPAPKAAAPKKASAPVAQRPSPAATPAPVEHAIEFKPEEEFGKGALKPGAGVTFPKVMYAADPTYTSEAMRNKIQGRVRIQAVIDVDGKIREARVIKSLDRLHGLDDAALDAAKRWEFEPAKRSADGVPVRADIELDMEFRLH
jgi:TonB family protein